MKNYRLQNSEGSDMVFTGKEIGAVTSRKPQTGQERWTELRVFLTDKGTYVGQVIGMTEVMGEQVRSKSIHVSQLSELVNFFGRSWLSKRLFDEMGIKTEVVI
jgi:gamma-glutamylcyclotransferase (GGCT)/AIG2-like uncharacterized protein YtfP